MYICNLHVSCTYVQYKCTEYSTYVQYSVEVLLVLVIRYPILINIYRC